MDPAACTLAAALVAAAVFLRCCGMAAVAEKLRVKQLEDQRRAEQERKEEEARNKAAEEAEETVAATSG